MGLFEAIHCRQSIGKVKPDPIPEEFIDRILDAAVQAPNHFRVRPWRFFVISGTARERLGDVMAQSLLKRSPNCSLSDIQKERSRPMRAPVIIAVSVDQPSEPKVVEIENVCAGAAAIQNMLLAAHALGLGAMWRTGKAAHDPEVKLFLGMQPDQHLIGFVYLGYPDMEREPPDRPSYHDRTAFIRE